MAVTPNSIITPQTPVGGMAKLVAANSNYDVPTAAVQVLAAQTNGARLTSIAAIPVATNVATDVQLYTYDGTNYTFKRAVALGAVTIAASNTAAISPVDFGYSDASPLILKAGESLYAAMAVANAGGVKVRAEGFAY